MLVNIVFFPPIKPGKEEEFKQWFVWSNEEFIKQEGFVRRKLLVPRGGGNYVSVVEFTNAEALQAIQKSPIHAEAQQKVLPLLDGELKLQMYETVDL